MTAYDVFCYIMLPVCIIDIIGAIIVYFTIFKKEYGNSNKQNKK